MLLLAAGTQRERGGAVFTLGVLFVAVVFLMFLSTVIIEDPLGFYSGWLPNGIVLYCICKCKKCRKHQEVLIILVATNCDYNSIFKGQILM